MNLSKTPINNIGQITESFLHFPIGTYVVDIWLWLEEQDDNFSVAAHLYSKEEIVICPYHG